jgi:hypothetical protein
MAIEKIDFDYITDVISYIIKGTNKGIETDIKLRDFELYFNDIICYEAVSRTNIEVSGEEEYPSNNIRAALIASGINREGKLEEGVHISSVRKYMESHDFLYAKNKIKYLETKYMGKLKDVLAEATVAVTSKDDIIDPAILVKLGTAVCDRDSDYYVIGYYNKDEELYSKEAKQLWLIEKQKYIDRNLTDKPYYLMLKDIFEGKQHHYPLVTKRNLEKAASFTYKLDRDEDVSLEDLQEVYKFNDASALVDVDIFEKYGDSVKESMNSYSKRHEKKAPLKVLK